jgi:hypothetical protein
MEYYAHMRHGVKSTDFSNDLQYSTFCLTNNSLRLGRIYKFAC